MPRPSAAAAAPAPLISNEQLRKLYVTLLRTRLLGERNRLKTGAPLVAREAIVTGTVTHLTRRRRPDAGRRRQARRTGARSTPCATYSRQNRFPVS